MLQILSFQTDYGFSARRQRRRQRAGEAAERPAPQPQPSAPAPRPQGPRSPEGPAVVDERDHVLHVAVRVLPLPQVLLLVQLRLLFVPGGHTATSEQPRSTAPTRSLTITFCIASIWPDESSKIKDSRGGDLC